MKGGADPDSNVSVGIIVPVYNEEATLDYYLSRLYEVTRGRYPVVVVDGGSTDNSRTIARRYFHTECISITSRALQMNHGARCLDTDVLLFLHADSELPRGFDFYVRTALAEDAIGGCFRLEFDHTHPLLRFYCWFTQFRSRFFHFGDQGFFVRSEIFDEMEGFAPLPFLEDVDFLKRLKPRGKFKTVSAAVKTSARRFVRAGIFRQQLKNVFLVTLFELGVGADRLARVYPYVR